MSIDSPSRRSETSKSMDDGRHRFLRVHFPSTKGPNPHHVSSFTVVKVKERFLVLGTGHDYDSHVDGRPSGTKRVRDTDERGSTFPVYRIIMRTVLYRLISKIISKETVTLLPSRL